jgi:hypothetical protein
VLWRVDIALALCAAALVWPRRVQRPATAAVTAIRPILGSGA